MRKCFFGAIILILSSSNLYAEKLDYYISNEKFYTSEGKIPNGCFGQLVTELNGDNSISSIFINRASLRGCIDANFPYPGADEEKTTYEIVSPLGNNSYKLKVCQETGGSMGASCDKILVEFKNKKYTMPKKNVSVLSLDT